MRGTTTPQRWLTRLAIAVLAVVGLLVTAVAIPAGPATASEQAAEAARALEEELLYLHNQTRRELGVRPLDGWADIRDVNRAWSRELGRTQSQGLRHNPRRDEQLCCWTGLGENVARYSMAGLSSDDVRKVARQAIQGTRESPGHWANLSDPNWEHMGIGVVIVPWDGHPGRYRAYMTIGFRTPSSAPNPSSVHYPRDSGPPTHSLNPEPTPTPSPTPAPPAPRPTPSATPQPEPQPAPPTPRATASEVPAEAPEPVDPTTFVLDGDGTHDSEVQGPLTAPGNPASGVVPDVAGRADTVAILVSTLVILAILSRVVVHRRRA